MVGPTSSSEAGDWTPVPGQTGFYSTPAIKPIATKKSATATIR